MDIEVSSNKLGQEPGTNMSSAGPSMVVDNATIVKDALASERSHATPTAQATKSVRVADSSFKEMPYTFLSPDDPALVTCM